MALKKVSFPTSRQSAARVMATLDRWARILDVFYIKNFGVLLEPIGKDLSIDTSKVQKVWDEGDMEQLFEEQIQLLEDWPEDLRKHEVDIPRCAVYFLAAMERKRYQLNRSSFGDCDRHIARLSLYELIMSCMYRQLSNSPLVLNNDLIERIMMFHQPWFRWQTDVQRMVVWTRRKEYENNIAFRPFLLFKIERLSCKKCRTRYSRLVDRMRSEYQTVSALGKPFNEKNYFGKLEEQPEYDEIMYLRQHKRT
jgi:hypothetical protein